MFHPSIPASLLANLPACLQAQTLHLCADEKDNG